MAIANVALTDTFDYWRSVTNSMVVALNDKLIYCNTLNSNTVSITAFASRTSNLTVNILTSTSINDYATGNVASAFTANSIHSLALSYATSANSNAQISVATITLGGNRTMAAPSNLKIGTYILHIIQDGSGSRTISWNSIFKWPAGVAPVLTTTPNRRDLFSFVCDGTNLYGSYLPDVR